MEQQNKWEEIGGEDGWELDAAEEAALDAAWERQRTPEFLARIARQEAEYDVWVKAYRKVNGKETKKIKK